MQYGRLERVAPLAGALFTLFFVVAFFVGGETPDVDSSGEEVIAHYDEVGSVIPVILALVIGAGLFLFFVGILRSARLDTERAPEWLATVVFGGGVAFSVALGIFAVGQIALLDAADLGEPQVAQALNIFDNDNFFPAVIALATMLLATGWHTLRSGMFPQWLGVVSLALGILALAGPAGFIAFLLFPIWVLVVSVLLYRRPAAPTTLGGGPAPLA
jgi:hypothetical protein